jgi:hypothetical protein
MKWQQHPHGGPWVSLKFSQEFYSCSTQETLNIWKKKSYSKTSSKWGYFIVDNLYLLCYLSLMSSGFRLQWPMPLAITVHLCVCRP